jgi:hypothetical protein
LYLNYLTLSLTFTLEDGIPFEFGEEKGNAEQFFAVERNRGSRKERKGNVFVQMGKIGYGPPLRPLMR